MKQGKILWLVLLVAAMIMAGCSGVQLDTAHKTILQQRITATCSGGTDVTILADNNAAYWQGVIEDSKKLFSGVVLNATYLDLCNQKLGYCRAGAARTISEEGKPKFRQTMCSHLVEFQKAAMGLK